MTKTGLCALIPTSDNEYPEGILEFFVPLRCCDVIYTSKLQFVKIRLYILCDLQSKHRYFCDGEMSH